MIRVRNAMPRPIVETKDRSLATAKSIDSSQLAENIFEPLLMIILLMDWHLLYGESSVMVAELKGKRDLASHADGGGKAGGEIVGGVLACTRCGFRQKTRACKHAPYDFSIDTGYTG
jgi:hypothetical protein